MARLQHTMYLGSEGENGWYELQEDNELISFDTSVNSLIVESDEESLAIRLNDRDGVWYIDAGKSEGVEGIRVNNFRVLKPAGTKIRWKALGY